MRKPIYLYITPFFPSPASWRGGFCLDAAKALMRDGRYDVRVMTFNRCNEHDYNWDGIQVSVVRRIAAPCGLVPFLLDGINNRFFRTALSKRNIDIRTVAVVHANTLTCAHYAAYFKRLNRNAKTIIQFHSCYSLTLASGRLGVLPVHATWLYLYYRRIYENVDILAFVSKMSNATFGLRFCGHPEATVQDVRRFLMFGRFLRDLHLPKRLVVYNGIDGSLFHPAPKTAHDGFVIGCVANFQPLKAQLTLLEAAALLKKRIPGLKVRLIGSGVTVPTCRAFVRAHELEDIVSFEREIDHRHLPDVYRALDLFVLPSRLEGFACVCVESLACGTPVIATSSISFAEVLPDDEKTRWTFPPLDPIGLAERIWAFYTHRWPQHIAVDLDINRIWTAFLNQIQPAHSPQQ